MNTAKVSQEWQQSGGAASERISAGGKEVYVKRVGRGLLLMPKDDPWASLVSSLDRFSEDFMGERVQPSLESREAL